MATYAIVINGTVENVIEWDGVSDWPAPTGAQVLPLAAATQCGVGWSYDGAKYSAPTVSA